MRDFLLYIIRPVKVVFFKYLMKRLAEVHSYFFIAIFASYPIGFIQLFI